MNMDFKENAKQIEKKIGYTFNDKSLLAQAFTRTSFCNEHSGYQSNEVLEFFGDSILSASIVTLFVREFTERYEHGIKTKLAEGDFTVIRSKLSDKKNLSERIRELELQQYLRMGEGDEKLGVRDEPSVMEDLFESIIGAVYIDSGMDMPRVIGVVSGMLDIKQYISSDGPKKSTTVQSFKNQLQEFCADKKRRLPPPVYKTVGESGPEHKKIYERACYIGEKLYAVGKGKNQKLADADAAEKTLAMLLENEKKLKIPAVDVQAISKLKEYAKSRKMMAPTFRDMGETEKSNATIREYAVMCIFGESSAVGTAQDKSSARCVAAEKVLRQIKKSSDKKESAQKRSVVPRVKKTRAKSSKKSIRKKAIEKQ